MSEKFQEFCNKYSDKLTDDMINDLKTILKIKEFTKCKGKTLKGDECSKNAKENGYCAIHDPEKIESTRKQDGKSSDRKNSTKKTVEIYQCNAFSKKTKEKCKKNGSVKPEESDFHYCLYHSKNYKIYENNEEYNNEPNE